MIHGEGLAILAGDGLLTEAFSLLTHPSPRLGPAGAVPMSAAARLRAIRTLSQAARAVGMVGGQAIDLAAAGSVPSVQPAPRLNRDTLQDMHARKTGP